MQILCTKAKFYVHKTPVNCSCLPSQIDTNTSADEGLKDRKQHDANLIFSSVPGTLLEDLQPRYISVLVKEGSVVLATARSVFFWVSTSSVPTPPFPIHITLLILIKMMAVDYINGFCPVPASNWCPSKFPPALPGSVSHFLVASPCNLEKSWLLCIAVTEDWHPFTSMQNNC